MPRSIQLVFLCIAAFGAMLAGTVLSPVQEGMRVALGTSDNQMALLQGPAIALPLALGGIPAGLLVDRFSRVHLLVVFAVGAVVGNVMTVFATAFPVLFAARCLVGITLPAMAMAWTSLVADLYPPDQRGRAYMVLSYGGSLGAPATFALAGMLVAVYGSDPNSWRWTILWLTSPLLIVSLLLTIMREPERSGAVMRNPSSRQAFAELWSYRRLILPLQAGIVLVAIVDAAALVWAVPALSREFPVSQGRIDGVMAVASLVSGLIGPAAGGLLADLAQRFGGPRRSVGILSLLALLSAPAGLFAVVPNLVSAGVLLSLFMTMGATIGLIGTTLGTVVIPNELRGLYIAVMSAVSAPFSTGLAPLVVSIGSGAMGGPAMLGRALASVCVAVSLLGAGILLYGRRRFPRARNESEPLSLA